MKVLIIACLAIGLAAAFPSESAQSSVLDLLKDLEGVAEEDGKVLITKLVNVIHHVEDSVLYVKEIVPKVNENIHEEADQILAGLKRISDEIQELLGKKNVFYGFDLLSGLTELPGGTKLSTALDLLMLANRAHRVMDDAKEFAPHLEKTLNKMQGHVESHVTIFASHVLKELGIQDFTAKSIMKKVEDLSKRVEEKGHKMILDIMHKMEQTFDILEKELPEEYIKVQEAVDEIRLKFHELVNEIEKSLVMRSFSILDIAGNMTGGTKLGTVFKVMSLVDKFNTVVQDVKNFGPRSQVFLDHSVKKVANSAQDFFSHAAAQLTE